MKAMAEPGAKPYGRRAFLALLAGGATSFLWAGRRATSSRPSPRRSRSSSGTSSRSAAGGSTPSPARCRSSIRAATRSRSTASSASRARFTYEELLALPRAHQVSTFHCVTGWTVRNVHWSGVRFSHVLDLVEPLPAAKAIRFDSLEVPYNDSLTLEQARAARRHARPRDGRRSRSPGRTGRPRAW